MWLLPMHQYQAHDTQSILLTCNLDNLANEMPLLLVVLFLQVKVTVTERAQVFSRED